MRRSIAAWCLGAMAIAPAACNRAVYFDCGENEQCTLEGQEGICLAGECAYPNGSCPSGFAYPAIARPGVAGRCVEPSDEMTTATPGPPTTGATTDPQLTSGEPSTTDPSATGSVSGDTDSDSDTGMPAFCDVRELQGGDAHTCARVVDEIYCWGNNSGFELGGPDVPETSATPVRVMGLPPAVELAVGKDHACIVSGAGEVYCWGRQDGSEVTGVSGTENFEPIRVELAAAHSVAVGSNFSCAALGGGVTCWGDSFWGQTGATSGVGFNQLLAGVAVERVVTGTLHTCALLADDLSLTCWGSNDWGQLGRGGPLPNDAAPQPEPAPPLNLGDNIADLELGATFSCATDGQVTACWGLEDDDQLLGMGTSTAPVVLDRLPRFEQLALGDRFACGRTNTGSVRCWGANDARQVDPQNQNSSGVVDVNAAIEALSGESITALQLGAGSDHTCLATDRRVACWGDNTADQLGDQRVSDALAFVSLPGCE